MDRIKNIRRKRIGFVLLLILLSFITFRNFIWGDYLFMFVDANDDTFQSFLPIYQMIVHCIQGNGFDFMEFSSGLGENILSMQLAIFDPFALIVYLVGLIFGIDKMAYALIFAHILRIICAGIACKYMLSFSRIDENIQYVCSILYAFSAYTLGDIGQHYFFATALVFIALGYGLVLHLFRDKKVIFILPLYVSLLCIWSTYFSFMILLACVFFFLYSLLTLNRKKVVLDLVIPVVLSVICGVLISAAVFVPSVLLILGNTDRVNDGLPLGDKIVHACKLFSINKYKDMFLRLFSNQLGGSINQWSGVNSSFDTEHLFYSFIFPVAFVEYIIAQIKTNKLKKKMLSLTFLVIGILGVMTHFFGTMMNAFATYSSRYLYVLVPFMAYVTGKYIDDIRYNGIRNKKKIFRLFLLSTINTAIILYCTNWNSISAKISAILVSSFLILILFIIISQEYISEKLWVILLGGLLIFFNCMDGNIAIESERHIVRKEWYRENGFNSSVEQAVSETGASGNDFWRMERSFMDWGIQPSTMYSNVANYRGVSFYNSLATPKLNKFRQKLLGLDVIQQTRATYAFGELGLPMDSVLADFYGLKYVISDYMVNDENWHLQGEYDGRYLYKNSSLECAGILYDSYFKLSEMESMSELEKQILISQAIGFDNNKDGFVKDFDLSNIEIEERRINESYISDELSSKGEAEFELQISDKYDTQSWLLLDIETESNGNLKVQYDIGFGFYDNFWANCSKRYVEGNNSILVKIPIGIEKIKLMPTTKVKIHNIKAVILHGVSYTNDGVELQNDNLSGVISGHISTDTNKILLLPIIYDNHWKATLDGKIVEIEEADYAFVAINIPAGQHNLLLTYSTPGLNIGKALSLVGMFIYIISILLFYINTHGNIKDHNIVKIE